MTYVIETDMSTPLNPLDFRTLPVYLGGAIAVGLGVYLLFGYYLYRRYYLLRKDDAAAWKCQPKRFPNAEMRAYDLNLGIRNIVGASLVSGGVAWYLSSGRGGVYLDFSKHGVAFSLFTALAYFLGTDYALYCEFRVSPSKANGGPRSFTEVRTIVAARSGAIAWKSFSETK